MKRLFTALTVVSTIAFAMPALAAPSIVSKKRLAMPVISRAAVQKYFGNKTWKYYYYVANNPQTNTEYRDIKNPTLNTYIGSEKMCGKTTYRLWMIIPDDETLSRRLNKRVYFEFRGQENLLQATRNGLSFWIPLQGYSDRMDCFGETVRILSTDGKFYTVNFADVKAGKLKTPVTLSPEARWSGAISLEGIDQLPGSIARSTWSPEVLGNSTIFVLEKDGRVTPHHPTRFMDFNTPVFEDLRPAFFDVSGTVTIIQADFYRLPDGYGVKERIAYEPTNPASIPASCYAAPEEPCGPEYPDWRIRNGQAQYEEVPPFQLTKLMGGIGVGTDSRTGIVLVEKRSFQSVAEITDSPPPRKTLLIHGVGMTKDTSLPLPVDPGAVIVGGDSGLRVLHPSKPNGGSVISETNERATLRYYVTGNDRKTQYWQAVIQK